MPRFSASDLKLNGSFPVKATFLNADGAGRHIVGFYTEQNGQAQDIRILFPDVCSETLRANVSSVFLGNRLGGRTPVFFVIENGYALNAGTAWFDDACAGRNGVFRLVAAPSKEDRIPVLHQGELMWKNADGTLKEPAATGNAVLLWQANDGTVRRIKGRLSCDAVWATVDGDKACFDVNLGEKAAFRLHVGEKNYADFVQNRVGTDVDFGGLAQIDALTVEIPADFDDTLYADSVKGLSVEAAGNKLTLKGRADAAVYETALFGVKVETDAQKPSECAVKLTFQTPNGTVVKTTEIEIAAKPAETVPDLELPASLPAVSPAGKMFVFSPKPIEKDDELPAFLIQANPVKSAGKTVLVTGATGKIGKETASVLASRGWDVLLQCKTAAADVSHLADDLHRKFGVRTAYIRADFTDEQERAGLVAALSETYGAIDALVNAADISVDTLSAALTPVETAVVLAQALSRQLPKGQKGAFVQIVRSASDFNGILAQKALETFAEEFQVPNVRLIGVAESENCAETVVSGLDNAFAVSQIKTE